MNLAKANLFFLLQLVAAATVFAQPFASWDNSVLKLNNGLVQREISLPAQSGKFGTTKYQPTSGDFKFFESQNADFQFSLNGQMYSGINNWKLLEIRADEDKFQGNGVLVRLESEDKKLELGIRFLLYPNLPVVRKSLSFKNLTSGELKLESVDVEKLGITPYWAPTFSQVLSDYGRRRSLGPFQGDMQDALVMLHNPDWDAGIVIGNEASGVMKNTSIFLNDREICSGLTHQSARFPFRKWLQPGGTYETPAVFTMVYNNCPNAAIILNTAVPDFVRKHLGIRLSELKEKPTFVYNTWHPFEMTINEKLVTELATAAAACGVKEFVIDEGWENKIGDWDVNLKKFPNGLKPVFDHIKSLGMKPGLWVSIGTAAPDSKIYNQHPEWFVKDKNGKPICLVVDEPDKYTACFGTGWYDYILGVLKKMVSDYGLEYLKLDFSVVTSPYRFKIEDSGCYAINHSGHKDHAESLHSNYEPMWQLFDELHKLYPNLFIDCTFETMGGLQLIDYALLKHAEGDWLSNYVFHGTKIDLRIRNIAWWRSPAVPSTALVIGNSKIDDAGWPLHLKSLAGALPMMLGDPRNLSPADKALCRSLADWLQAMQSRHDFMSFRQDLPGFGEPQEGSWDGFQRINTDTKTGGIVGVFRQGAKETQRTVTVNYLDPSKNYIIKQAPSGKVISQMTGKELEEKGFEVRLLGKYDGELFEISTK